LTVSVSGEALGLGVPLADADGVGEDEEGDGGAGGVGVGGPCNVKLAHGPGGTVAHSRCAPGLSPGKGVTTFEKLPLESLVTLAATWDCVSQKRLIDSLARKYVPVAVIRVLGPPAAKSRTMLAATGVGVGVAQGPLAGHPVWNPARAIGEMATSTAAATIALTINRACVTRNLGTGIRPMK
jgi:hypothetical protein